MCMKVVAIDIDAFYSSYSTRFLLRIFLSALLTAALSFYQALKKILYSVVEEIDLDLHGVNYLSFGLCSVLHSTLLLVPCYKSCLLWGKCTHTVSQ